MKIKNYPVFIIADTKTISCKGEFDSSITPSRNILMENGKGYLDVRDGHFWIFSSVKPRNPNEYPHVWIESGRYVKSKPSFETLEKFNGRNAINMQLPTIMENAENSDDTAFYNDTVIADLNANSEKFHPVTYQFDDFLKKIIKSVFNSLNISLSKLKSKAQQKYMISNMKSAVLTNTKMSVKYFNAWAELLGLKVTIIVETDENAEDKLSEPLVYLSTKDSVVSMSECYIDELGVPRYNEKEN